MVESLPDPLVFLEAIRDDSGVVVDFRYVDANEAACAYNQRSRADMIGATLLEVLPGHEASGLLAAYAHVVDTGEPLAVDGLAYYNEVLQQDRRSDVRGIRVGDGLSLMWRDVTERYEQRDELEQVLGRYRLLAENGSDVAYLTAPDRTLAWISPAVTRVLGWQTDDLLGSPFTFVLHPDDLPIAAGWLARLDQTGDLAPTRGAPSEPVRIRQASGEYLWCALTGSLAHDDEGAYVGLVGAIHDVDELVRTRMLADAERQHLQSTLDSLFDPHAFLSPLWNDGVIVDFVVDDINRAGSRYLGVSRSDAAGQRLSVLLPDVVLSGLHDLLADVLRSGEPLALDDYAYRNDAMSVEHHYDIRAVAVGSLLSCTVRDITHRVLAERAVLESETRFRLIAQNSADIVVHLRDGIAEWVSPPITVALGWQPEEAVGLSGVAWVHPDDLEAAVTALAAVDIDAPNRARFRMRAKDGTYHWLDGHAAPFIGLRGEPDGIVVSARVVDEEVAAQQALEVRARVDLLTGLANREELFEHFGGRMGAAARSGQRVAVIFGDLDDFKGVNDTFGHAAGDAFLRTVAQRIVHGVRRRDFVARIGGDELLVVLDGVHDEEEAVAIAEKLRASVGEPVTDLGVTMRSTISMGVTLAEPGEAMDAVVARADRAMYAAKETGRDRVVATSAAPSGTD